MARIKNKIKVVFIIPSLGKGGAERLILDICRQFNVLEQIDYKLIVLNRVNDYEEAYNDLKQIYLDCKVELSVFFKNIIDVSSLTALIEEYQPDIIHSHIYYADLVARLNIFKSVKYVSHIHGRTKQFEKFPVNGFLSKESYTNEFEKRFIFRKYKEVDNYFISVSSFYCNYLLENTIIKRSRILTLPNAIDLDRFYVEPLLKEKYDVLNLITIGRLEPHKGHRFLVEVINELVHRGENIHLTILGDGSEFKNLKNQIKTLNLEKYISLQGNVGNPELYLKRADLYIHGAFDEPFGLVLVEAMASGLPVVSTDAGGSNELIIEGENGFIIKNRDVHTFVDVIIRLKNDSNQLNKMSKFSNEFSKSFSIKDYTTKLINFYNSILQC